MSRNKNKRQPNPRRKAATQPSNVSSKPRLPSATGWSRGKVIGWTVFLSAAVLIAGTFQFWIPWLIPPSAVVEENPQDESSDPSTPREEFLQIAARISSSTERHLGTQQIPMLRQQMNRARAQGQPLGPLHIQLCLNLLRLGDVDGAAEEIETAFALADSTPGFTEDMRRNLHQLRSIVYLRQAEVENCVARHNRDCCIFPLSGGGIHSEKVPAAKARDSILAVLQSEPDNLSAKWLLNITAMALGEYPTGVPAEQLIPPSAFESDFDIGRFVDIAPALGLDTFNLCGGVIVDDFDGDRWLDIITSTYDPSGPLSFFRNQGDGTFEDLSTASGLSDQLGGLNLVGADYDNDGDTDILVLRGAWLFDLGQIRNSLLRNNGDGTFTDVTRESGLALPAAPTQAAVWGDFDNDGDLDLFVGNESRFEMENGAGSYPSQLFRNEGNGTFTDIAAQAGVTNDRYCKAVASGDFDNDGDLDLYVSNIGANRLYRNDGDGKFTDVAETLGVTEPAERSFAAWFFDYNHDGWLDLFVAAYDCDIDDIAADYLGLPHDGVSPRLYENDGQGGFVDVTEQRGLNHPSLPMGANFGDLDNDGWLDIYLGTGDPEYRTLMPNVMLRNAGGETFQNVTTSGGFGHLQKGHGVAFADLDHDGDQDIYHQLGGFYPGDKFRNALFQNPGHGNRWMAIKLVGVKSNRMGYGARIRVTLETPGGLQVIHRAVGSVSSFGGSPSRQEIGLGNATKIVKIEVDWPASGIQQAFRDLPLDHLLEITETNNDVVTVKLEKTNLP